jgi:hypothetical protein
MADMQRLLFLAVMNKDLMPKLVQKDIPSFASVLDQATKIYNLMHKDKDPSHNGIHQIDLTDMEDMSTKSSKDPTTVVTTAAMATKDATAPEETHTEEDMETRKEATNNSSNGNSNSGNSNSNGNQNNRPQPKILSGASFAKQSRPTNHV